MTSHSICRKRAIALGGSRSSSTLLASPILATSANLSSHLTSRLIFSLDTNEQQLSGGAAIHMQQQQQQPQQQHGLGGCRPNQESQQQQQPTGSPSTGLVLRDTQRRESFLYRTNDYDYEISPKSISRHSSIGSEW